ncbi:PREDICTED: putative F-box protein At1g70970 [Camelina sativa]|uniref:F-box protein At1g70970 n=1 Tax=Camelina sativa TaxID=90675 RepID=A0ABM1R2U4_CAMSA|nr:PREDICTED: putative F-box protein At1g70970 [Camelina sativa]
MDSSSFDFESLHEDLQMQILSWLPLKSLVKFLIVSKKWASIILGEQFRKIYLSRSMTRPRLMFMIERYTSQPPSAPPELDMSWLNSVYQEGRLIPVSPDTEVLFHSVYQEEKPLLSSGQQQLRIPIDIMACHFSQPIRGLICLQLGTKFAIFNPGAKKLRKLPEIQAHENAWIKSFLGYDEATNVFKVLCRTSLMMSGQETKEYHVLTVGSVEDEEPWRRITCKYDHSPAIEGLWKEGVLYYGARFSIDKSLVVMSFNVRSEQFSTVIEFPDGSAHSRWNFVIYDGNIALVDNSDFDNDVVNEPDGTKVFQIFVLDETARKWRGERIKIHCWEQNVGDMELHFRGTIGTGKLVFAHYHNRYGRDLFVLYYDTVTKIIRMFNIGNGRVVGDYDVVQTFLDHVDSLFLM